MSLILDGSNGVSDIDGSASTPAIRGTDANTGIFFPAADTIAFAEGGTESMRLDSSGNVGIGTSSPAILGGNYTNLVLQGKSSTNGGYFFTQTSDGAQVGQMGIDTGVIYIGSRSNHPAAFTTNNTERMRITSGGDLLVGTTTSRGIGTFFASSGNVMGVEHTGSGTVTAIQFRQGSPSVVCGSITMANASSTAYNTNSDYRLKENIAPMTGALDKVAQLNPVTYNWKADGSAGQGFIAHELQAIVPDCVTGEKDAVDADGNPVYQGVDTSFLVATLTAALQEAHGLIKDLQARVDALESK